MVIVVGRAKTDEGNGGQTMSGEALQRHFA